MNYPKGEPEEIEISTDGVDWTKVNNVGTWFPDAFIGSILNLMEPKEQMDCTVTDAYETMACVEAAYQSNQSSRIPVNS